MTQLHPLTLAFHHVKGHQDRQKDYEMTIPERLNVGCDRRAAQVPIPCPDSTIQKNPLINTAYPHVTVDGQVILRQLQSKLRNAATFPGYWEYLQNIFQWPNIQPVCVH